MNWRKISLRGLQLFSLLSATVAVAGGGSFVLAGTDAVAIVVGIEHPSLSTTVQSAADGIPGETRLAFDTLYRALGWHWLITGVMLLWITPTIAHRTDWYRFIQLSFMAVGVANAMMISKHGTSALNTYVGLIPEIGVSILAIIWQSLVARQQATTNSPG